MQRSLLSFIDFFVRNISQKIRAWRESKSLVPKYLGTPNKEKLVLLDKSLLILTFLHHTMISFQGIRFCSMFGSNFKKVLEKLRERRLWLSPF